MSSMHHTNHPNRSGRPRANGAGKNAGTRRSRAHAKAAEAPSRTRERRERKAAAGPCPIMRECGGCEWIGMPYKKQLARKHAAMVELFTPIIKRFGWDVDIEPVRGMDGPSAGAPANSASIPADAETAPRPRAPRAFRHKAATPFAPGAKGAIRSGFFARGTHRIVAVEDCPVEAGDARRILNGVARAAERLGIAAYNEDSHRGILRYAIARLGWKTDEVMLTVVTAQRDLPHAEEFARELAAIDPRIVCVAQNVNGRPGNAILGSETRIIAGEPRMHDGLLGCTFEISPTAFYQTNPAQTETLYQIAIDGMGLRAGDVLLDAYCGSGTIGLCAAAAAHDAGLPVRLIGVERNPSGVADARQNALVNGFDEAAATFIADDATAYMRRAAAAGERIDVICLDPPRAGSTPEFLGTAAALAPRRIVYISCNPITQERDLAVLGEAGYRLARLVPVDMFPHTGHVETVAVLSR